MSSINCGLIFLERGCNYEMQDKNIFALNPLPKKDIVIPNIFHFKLFGINHFLNTTENKTKSDSKNNTWFSFSHVSHKNLMFPGFQQKVKNNPKACKNTFQLQAMFILGKNKSHQFSHPSFNKCLRWRKHSQKYKCNNVT